LLLEIDKSTMFFLPYRIETYRRRRDISSLVRVSKVPLHSRTYSGEKYQRQRFRRSSTPVYKIHPYALKV
jgi:hypothetical protein